MSAEPSAVDLPTLQGTLGPAAVVREIKDGAATFPGRVLEKVEISSNWSVLLTVRNESDQAFDSDFLLRFYNSFGILIYQIKPSFRSEAVPANSLVTKQYPLGPLLSPIETASADSTMVPKFIWKTPRFAARSAIAHAVTTSGVTGRDARWSNYGDYMDKFQGQVLDSWAAIRSAQKSRTKAGDSVQVVFILNASGNVTKVVQLTPSPGTSDREVRI